MASPRSWPRGTLYGIGAIILPIGLHLAEAREYVHFFLPNQVFDMVAPCLWWLSRGLVALMAANLFFDVIRSGTSPRWDVTQRLICLCGWLTLSPLSGFSVWFVGRHSLQHLLVCHSMFGGGRLYPPRDFVVISCVAILGLVPLAAIFDLSDIHQIFSASLCLVAGLTLPHVIVSRNLKPR